MNKYSREKKAFLFILDFDLRNPIILPIENVNNKEISYSFNGVSNYSFPIEQNKNIELQPSPIDYDSFLKKFQRVQNEIQKGNSYLLNLTFKTKITHNSTLSEIFQNSIAPYKLHLKDKLVVFSPESFVKISNGKIYTFPMKGTAIL